MMSPGEGKARPIDAAAKRLRDASVRLGTFDEARPALAGFIEDFPELFPGSVAVSYGLCQDREGLGLDFSFGLAVCFHRFAAWIRSAPNGWALYDPIRPQRDQRNVALRLSDLGGRSPKVMVEFLSQFDLGRADQLRVLVCDGPVLLAWVGGFRDAAFTELERRALARLARPLQRRLRLERQLGSASLDAATAVAALDSLSTAAFVVSARGRVAKTNRVACALLERDRGGTMRWLADVLRGEAGDATTTRLAIRGVPPHYLIVRTRPPDDPDARVAAAAERWQLTSRQREVLALLARGAANKTIAATLRCAESTVEIHVTALLDKANVESRGELIARVWMQSPGS